MMARSLSNASNATRFFLTLVGRYKGWCQISGRLGWLLALLLSGNSFSSLSHTLVILFDIPRACSIFEYSISPPLQLNIDERVIPLN